MDFDIVIATRNRKSALSLSLPLILLQNRLPHRLVIVDSSENHTDIREFVEKVVSDSNVDIDLQIVKSDAGSSLQRNIGLEYVKSPIVIFPDDDALWFQNVAASILNIYEKDNESLIGAVCATASKIPPLGVISDVNPVYQMEFRDRLAYIVDDFASWFEDRFFPDPFFTDNYPSTKEIQVPLWLEKEDAILSGPMTGFRMSFRSDLIKRFKFDEALGRYSLFEDRDASLSILHNYLIVRSLKAKVFHYRIPEKRVDGIEWAVMHILNRAYIICKHHSPESTAYQELKKYLYYKLARYLLQAHTRYGRQRVIGAWRALSRIHILLDTPKEQLTHQYIKLRGECLRIRPVASRI